MVQLRQATGLTVGSGQPVKHNYDEVIAEGVVLGFCFRYENVIHWQVSKASIPPVIIKQAVRLLQDRNERSRDVGESGIVLQD